MTFEFPVMTAIAAALLLILQLSLMLTVGRSRFSNRQGIGDGGDERLALLIRRHGNLAENAPMFLLVLALLEIIGGDVRIVGTLAAAFVVVRVFHAIGLTIGTGPNIPRFIGAMGTVVSGLVASIYLLIVVAGANGFSG